MWNPIIISTPSLSSDFGFSKSLEMCSEAINAFWGLQFFPNGFRNLAYFKCLYHRSPKTKQYRSPFPTLKKTRSHTLFLRFYFDLIYVFEAVRYANPFWFHSLNFHIRGIFQETVLIFAPVVLCSTHNEGFSPKLVLKFSTWENFSRTSWQET